jgi:hypothetical protein
VYPKIWTAPSLKKVICWDPSTQMIASAAMVTVCRRTESVRG